MTSRTAKAKEARHERQCREVKEQRAPTEKEAAAILTAQAKAATLPTRPEIRSEITGQTAQSLPLHNDHKGWSAQLQAAFGSESSTFCGALLTQLEPLVRADPKERATDGQTNYALALMAGIDPENELEAAMGAQIVAAHTLSLDYLARSRRTDFIDTAAAYVNMATKLSRTMAVQVEALAKLRSGGKQRIEVIYVNGPAVIGDGTQAVFGGVGTGGTGGGDEKRNQSHAHEPEVRSEDASLHALPSPCDQGQEALSDARWQERCAERSGERPLHVGTVHEGASRSPRASPRRRGQRVA